MLFGLPNKTDCSLPSLSRKYENTPNYYQITNTHLYNGKVCLYHTYKYALSFIATKVHMTWNQRLGGHDLFLGRPRGHYTTASSVAIQALKGINSCGDQSGGG